MVNINAWCLLYLSHSVHAKLLQLCLALCNPMDCSPAVSSVHEISQAKILELGVISSSRGSSKPRDQTHLSWVSSIGRWIIYHIKKQRYYFANKVHLVKAIVFPVVMYGCESWTVKKAEHRRIDALELQCWRRLLRVPWTKRRPNQSILKEINPEYLLEGLVLMLKLQLFGHLIWRALEKILMQGKIEREGEGDNRSWVGWVA